MTPICDGQHPPEVTLAHRTRLRGYLTSAAKEAAGHAAIYGF